MYLRPTEYEDTKGMVNKIPDGYNWTLNQRVYIKDEGEIDYVFGLIEQSCQNTKKLDRLVEKLIQLMRETKQID